MLRRLMSFFKVIYKTEKFKKNSNYENNTVFGASSNCFNDGGIIDIGKSCDIQAIISVKENAKVSIGSYTTIRGGSVLGAQERITIGDYVIISSNVTIYDNNNHPTSPEERKRMCLSGFTGDLWNWKYSDVKPICIEDNVWIGEKSFILKGVTIGEGSVIGCNSVVTKDIPPYCVAAGNPAVVVKKLNHD